MLMSVEDVVVVTAIASVGFDWDHGCEALISFSNNTIDSDSERVTTKRKKNQKTENMNTF